MDPECVRREDNARHVSMGSAEAGCARRERGTPSGSERRKLSNEPDSSTKRMKRCSSLTTKECGLQKSVRRALGHARSPGTPSGDLSGGRGVLARMDVLELVDANERGIIGVKRVRGLYETSLAGGSLQHAPCAMRAWDGYTTKASWSARASRPKPTLARPLLSESSERESSPSGAWGEAAWVRGSARGVLE